MTDDQRDELIIDMHGKVTQMFGVLYENGLVAKVERHEAILREGHLTCPVRMELESHIKQTEAKKYNIPVWTWVVFSVMALGIPFVERAIFK